MFSLAKLFILGGLSLMLVGSEVEAASLKMMALGDSITYGMGSSDLSGYRKTLVSDLIQAGVETEMVGSLSSGDFSQARHEGHPGFTIDQIRAGVVDWISKAQPRQILLMIGTNDIFQARDPENMPTKLTSLIEQIFEVSPEAQLFVSDLLPLGTSGSWVTSYNQAIPGIVREEANRGRAIYFVPMNSVAQADELPDGVHPHDAIYARMAERWFHAISWVKGFSKSKSPAKNALKNTGFHPALDQ